MSMETLNKPCLAQVMDCFASVEQKCGPAYLAESLLRIAKDIPVDTAMEALVRLYACSAARLRDAETTLATIHSLSKSRP